MDKQNTCPHVHFKIITKKETYKVKGEDISILAKVKVCSDCNEEIFDFELDSDNLNKAYDIYRQNHNLLSTQDIIAIRQKYNLSQRAFSALIGCTQATVVRYEKGAIPNTTYNNILKLMDDPKGMQSILNDNKDKLSAKEFAAIKERLDKMLLSTLPLTQIKADINTNDVNIFSGFKPFNLIKFAAMVVYFALNQDNLYKTKLMKLLWYADMYHFKTHSVSISGSNYIHQHYGPIPKQSYTLLGRLEDDNFISIQEQNNGGEIILAEKFFDYQKNLTEDELNTLQIISHRFQNVSTREISNISHKEVAYIKTQLKQQISFAYALDLLAI